MRGRYYLVAFALLTGCFAAEDAPAPSAATTSAEETAPREAEAPLDAPIAAVEMPIALDGNVGTGAVACAMPAQQCVFHEAVQGTSGVLVEGLAGTILGGSIVISWTPSSPATQELAAGFMVMGAEGCDGIELAGAQGASPLTLTFPAMERALCAGEIVHLWVAGTHFGSAADQAYYQVDVDQAFRAEGAFSLLPAR